jgi:putative glutamine amidotransferase
VLLTPHFTLEVQAALWSRPDGLVLTGGGDIEPSRFGETRHATVDDVSPARDALELGLTLRAVKDEVPLFAICRGIQVLNVALGGTLVQDIPSEWPNALTHSQKEPRDQPTHTVKVMGEGICSAAVQRSDLRWGEQHASPGHQAARRWAARGGVGAGRHHRGRGDAG